MELLNWSYQMGTATRLFSLFFVILFFCSCTPKDCINMVEEAKWKEKTLAWKAENVHSKQIINTANNIGQTIEVKEAYSSTPNSVGDDCGNEITSERYEYTYKASIAPIYFWIYLSSASSDIDGYKLQFNMNETYDFMKDNGNRTEYIGQKELNGTVYQDIIHFQPAENQQNEGDYAITSVYYVKGKGVVQFTVKKGFTYQVK